MWKRHWKVCQGLFLATCCVAFSGTMFPLISLAVGERRKLHYRGREMIANPHFEQLLNPTNENAQNAPVGDTAPSPSPVVNLHVDLPNTDKYNAKASRMQTRELQDTVNTGQRKFEEDIFDFQQIIQQQAEEMKDLLALAEMITSVSKGEQAA